MTNAVLLGGRMAAMSLGGRTAASAVSTRAVMPNTAVRCMSTTPQLYAPKTMTDAASEVAGEAKKKASKATDKVASAAKSTKDSAKKTVKPKVEKLAAWQKKGPDGKLIPLPMATKPKRQSLYGVFMRERFNALRGDSSLMSKNKDGVEKFDAVKFSRLAAEEWKALSETEKQKFLAEKAKLDKEYDTAMEKWREALTPEDIRRQNAYNTAQRRQGKRAGANLRDPAKPQRPMTALFSYMGDLRKSGEDGGLQMKDFAKKASETFKELSADARKKYDDMAASAREEYQRQMREYKRNIGE